jgi:integrase
MALSGLIGARNGYATWVAFGTIGGQKVAKHKLTQRFVDRQTKPGKYADGDGLVLQIGGGGGTKSKCWIFRYSRKRFGKPGDGYMGLGPVRFVTLDAARELAVDCNRQLLRGIDPVEARKAVRASKLDEASKLRTFEQDAADYLAFKNREWEPETAAQGERAVRLYLNPVLGKLLTRNITAAQVYQALIRDNLWYDKHPTAVNARLHAEQIFHRAGRKGENNPATMDALEGKLHRSEVVHTPEEQPGLPYSQIGVFMKKVRAYRPPNQPGGISMSAKLLEFIILTGVRTDEARLARWKEIDYGKRLWTVPAIRDDGSQGHKTGKKTKQPHVVPLSRAAIRILEEMRVMQKEQGIGSGPDQYVFAHAFPSDEKQHRKRLLRGGRGLLAGQPLNENAARVFLKKYMGGGQLVNTDGKLGVKVHGFRTTYQMWAVEVDHADPLVYEMALCHKVGEAMFGKYAGRDPQLLIRDRAQNMENWGEYCKKIAAPVTELQWPDRIPVAQLVK